MDMENTLIVENAETTTDVLKVYDTAVKENKKFYVAISKSGRRFGVKGGTVIQLADEEFAENDKYVEPKIETESIVDNENANNDELAEPIEEENTNELTVEEITERNEKIAHYDELVNKNNELTTRNIELQDEIAKLNTQIEELSLKVATPVVTENEEYIVSLADVIEFMKSNGIHTLSI